MAIQRPPYADDDLTAAFPEYQIDLPELGLGSFKAAYHVIGTTGEAVLKVVKEPVAVDPDGAVTLPERFEREIAGMNRVTSARVVPVLDGPAVRDIGGAPFVWYLEPYYAGGTLESRAGPRLTVAEAIDICTALLEGVDALWSQARIVHRDIKPGNVALSAGGPVLLDLGIALHVDLSALTNAFGASPRTMRYAAPEQFDLRLTAPLGTRTDLFLVGMTVFEIATGAHPFMKGPDNEYVQRLMSGSLDEAALRSIGHPCLERVLRRLLRSTRVARSCARSLLLFSAPLGSDRSRFERYSRRGGGPPGK